MLTDQQDTGTQVRIRWSEEEASTGLQKSARHLNMVVGEVWQQHLLTVIGR